MKHFFLRPLAIGVFISPVLALLLCLWRTTPNGWYERWGIDGRFDEPTVAFWLNQPWTLRIVLATTGWILLAVCGPSLVSIALDRERAETGTPMMAKTLIAGLIVCAPLALLRTSLEHRNKTYRETTPTVDEVKLLTKDATEPGGLLLIKDGSRQEGLSSWLLRSEYWTYTGKWLVGLMAACLSHLGAGTLPQSPLMPARGSSRQDAPAK